jgi:hypothetical protein
MAVFRVIVGFFALAFLVEGKLNGLYSPQDHREVQDEGLLEKHPCLLFDSPAVQIAIGSTKKLASPECDANQCSGGCCRYHTQLLVCDEENDFPHQAVSEEL